MLENEMEAGLESTLENTLNQLLKPPTERIDISESSKAREVLAAIEAGRKYLSRCLQKFEQGSLPNLQIGILGCVATLLSGDLPPEERTRIQEINTRFAESVRKCQQLLSTATTPIGPWSSSLPSLLTTSPSSSSPASTQSSPRND
jgi:hypothetical protein